MTAPQRFGNKTYEEVLRYNDLFGNNPVWLGPRGRDYGAMLEHPKPYQIANLYPDSNSSYWIAQFELPVRAQPLTLNGRFPLLPLHLVRAVPPRPARLVHRDRRGDCRRPDRAGRGLGEPLRSRQPAARPRTATTRSASSAKEAPERTEDREPNTLYTGQQGLLQMCYRVYLPDVGPRWIRRRRPADATRRSCCASGKRGCRSRTEVPTRSRTPQPADVRGDRRRA